jgi:predicted HNH restriction endonuclease
MLCGIKAAVRFDTYWGRTTLEVNHIVPVVGDRSSYSCNHHQDNLQVVCVDCHRLITNQQHKSGAFKKPLTA